MYVGNLNLGEKLILAPMAEITDAPFRKIAKEYGAGLVFTQMVSADGVNKGNFTSLRYLTYHSSEKPIGIQLLGNDPNIIYHSVKKVVKYNPDLIDLNCGCPVEKVTNHGMGSCILDDSKLLGELVKAMVEASNGIPVSIKVRLGWNKKNINIIENANIAKENGASLIFVHARSKDERYETPAHWEWIKKLKENLDIPVVGNGSVFTPQDALRMKEETNCDSVMVARGALGNPFVFRRFNTLVEKGEDPGLPPLPEVQKVALAHIEMLFKEYDEITALDRAKKNVIWYFKNYPGLANIINNIFAIRSQEKLIDFVKTHVLTINKNYKSDESLMEYQQKFKKRVIFWLSDGETNKKFSKTKLINS